MLSSMCMLRSKGTKNTLSMVRGKNKKLAPVRHALATGCLLATHDHSPSWSSPPLSCGWSALMAASALDSSSVLISRTVPLS